MTLLSRLQIAENMFQKVCSVIMWGRQFDLFNKKTF